MCFVTFFMFLFENYYLSFLELNLIKFLLFFYCFFIVFLVWDVSSPTDGPVDVVLGPSPRIRGPIDGPVDVVLGPSLRLRGPIDGPVDLVVGPSLRPGNMKIKENKEKQ